MKKFFITVAFLVVAAVTIYVAKENSQNKSSAEQADSSSLAPTDSASRQPAGDSQQAVIDQMTQIILSIADRSEVVPKAQQVIALAAQKDPNSQMPGVQLLAGYMKMLPGLEGIIYRCRNIVEPSDYLHMTALNALRSFRYNSYLYGQHVLAIFDFLTVPSRNAGPEFKNVTDLQVFLVSRAAPLLEQLTNQARAMESLPPENFNFKLNRTLFVGVSGDIRFLDRNETIKQFIKPYLYSVTFSLQRTLGAIYYWSALNLDDVTAVATEITAATAINEMRGKLRSLVDPGGLANGLTPAISFNVIRKHPNYFTFRDLHFNDQSGKPSGVAAQTLLNKAYFKGLTASYYELAAFNCVIQYTVSGNHNGSLKDCAGSDNQDYSSQHAANGQDYLFNPNELLIDYRIKKAALIQRYSVFLQSSTKSQPTETDSDPGRYAQITSEVTGKTLQLNVRALFNAKNSPRNFFPTKFANDGRPSYKTDLGVYGWNYDNGFPTSYGAARSDYSFGGFFNPSEVSDLKSLETAMATLIYTKSLTTFAVFLPVPSPVVIPVPSVDALTVN